MKKLTEKDFEEFKKHCQYYIQKFNLKDWRVYYDFKKLKDLNAQCVRDVNNHTSTLTLSKQIEEELTIKELAKHECIHVLVGTLSDYATTRYLERREVNLEEERLVVILEKLL